MIIIYTPCPFPLPYPNGKITKCSLSYTGFNPVHLAPDAPDCIEGIAGFFFSRFPAIISSVVLSLLEIVEPLWNNVKCHKRFIYCHTFFKSIGPLCYNILMGFYPPFSYRRDEKIIQDRNFFLRQQQARA